MNWCQSDNWDGMSLAGVDNEFAFSQKFEFPKNLISHELLQLKKELRCYLCFEHIEIIIITE